jgi:hypothetical protein
MVACREKQLAIAVIVQPFLKKNNKMKKIKLKISELTNPELLSVETMKSLQGGAACYTGTCYADGYSGFCEAHSGGELCQCKTENGTANIFECYA